LNKLPIYICIVSLLSPVALLAKQTENTKFNKIDTTSGRMVYSFETINMPEREDMGLVGGTFLYDFNDWFAAGVSTYGAVTGDQGGFISLGLAAEIQHSISPLFSVKAGLFVGAGGGRGGPDLQGGGLMLRPHLGLYLEEGSFQGLGAGVSHVEFPNGNISSTQAYITYQQSFDTLIGKGWLKKNEGHGSLSSVERELFLVAKRYDVNSSVVDINNLPQHPSISLLGIEWNHYLNENFFLKLESAGAMGGESRGYMQTLAGAGYRYGLSDSTFLKVTGQIGMAGGGDVSTGGGILLDSSMILQLYITNDMFIAFGAGYTIAPDGDFEATNPPPPAAPIRPSIST